MPLPFSLPWYQVVPEPPPDLEMDVLAGAAARPCDAAGPSARGWDNGPATASWRHTHFENLDGETHPKQLKKDYPRVAPGCPVHI